MNNWMILIGGALALLILGGKDPSWLRTTFLLTILLWLMLQLDRVVTSIEGSNKQDGRSSPEDNDHDDPPLIIDGEPIHLVHLGGPVSQAAGVKVLGEVGSGPDCPKIVGVPDGNNYTVWWEHSQLAGMHLDAADLDAVKALLPADASWDIYQFVGGISSSWHVVNLTAPGNGTFRHPLSRNGRNVLIYRGRCNANSIDVELVKLADLYREYVSK